MRESIALRTLDDPSHFSANGSDLETLHWSAQQILVPFVTRSKLRHNTENAAVSEPETDGNKWPKIPKTAKCRSSSSENDYNWVVLPLVRLDERDAR